MTPHADVPPGACAQPTFSPSFWLGLCCLLVIASCAASPSRPTGAALLGSLALALAAVLRVSPRLLAARLMPLALFVLCTFLIVALVPAAEGAATVSLPLLGLQVPRQALSFVTALALKSALVLVFVTAMASRLTERALLEGLAGLHLPPKVVGLCYMTVRSLHSVGEETRRLVRGRDARGRPRGLRALRVAGAMAQVLMVRLGRRAETQALALVARGFEGRITLCEERRLSLVELLLSLPVAAALAWVVSLR